MIELKTPITSDQIEKLKCGDTVTLSGVIYTARDEAHQRMIQTLEKGEELPFDVNGQAIFYVGPSPSRPGQVIGASGPTTSYRMDDLTVPLLEKGLKIMIGKGKRNDTVIEGMKENKAVYLIATGGAGAYISNSIKKCEVIAYDDLGPEAIRRLEVEDLQLIVGIDCYGENIYNYRKKYAK